MCAYVYMRVYNVCVCIMYIFLIDPFPYGKNLLELEYQLLVIQG